MSKLVPLLCLMCSKVEFFSLSEHSQNKGGIVICISAKQSCYPTIRIAEGGLH